MNESQIRTEVFMCTSKPYDSAIGMYYQGARFYDSSTGRLATKALIQEIIPTLSA